MTRLVHLECSCCIKLKSRAGQVVKAKLSRCSDHKSAIKATRAAYEATKLASAA